MFFDYKNLPAVPVRKWTDWFAVNYYLRKGYAGLLNDRQLYELQQLKHRLAFGEFLRADPGTSYTHACMVSGEDEATYLKVYKLTRVSKLKAQMAILTADPAGLPFAQGTLDKALDVADALAEAHGGEAMRLVSAGVKALPIMAKCSPTVWDELHAYLAAMPA